MDAETHLALIASLQRAVRAMDRRGPPGDASAVEWCRALDETRRVLRRQLEHQSPSYPRPA